MTETQEDRRESQKPVESLLEQVQAPAQPQTPATMDDFIPNGPSYEGQWFTWPRRKYILI